MDWQSWLGTVADGIGILGAIFALAAWMQTRLLQRKLAEEEQRRNQEIKVVLKYNSHRLELPLKLRRSEVNRAEVLGRLGMMPMKEAGSRFALTYLSHPEFLQRIDEIRQGADDSTVLEIPCTREEIEQFDLPIATD